MNFDKIIEKLFGRFLTPKNYEFRFDEYDGSESTSFQVYNTAVEYILRNTGTTSIIINDGMKLYPPVSGIGPSEIKVTLNYNEKDVTIYNYKFVPTKLFIGNMPATYAGVVVRVDVIIADDAAYVPSISPTKRPAYNRLLVISKVLIPRKSKFQKSIES